MLVLRRRTGQSIVIGDEIEVVVLEVSGDHVRLGIAAPREIRVLRQELVAEIQDENRRAAASQRDLDDLAGALGSLRAPSPSGRGTG